MIRTTGSISSRLARIFLETGRTPDEIWAKPPGVRAFCLASIEELIRVEAANRG